MTVKAKNEKPQKNTDRIAAAAWRSACIGLYNRADRYLHTHAPLVCRFPFKSAVVWSVLFLTLLLIFFVQNRQFDVCVCCLSKSRHTCLIRNHLSASNIHVFPFHFIWFEVCDWNFSKWQCVIAVVLFCALISHYVPLLFCELLLSPHPLWVLSILLVFWYLLSARLFQRVRLGAWVIFFGGVFQFSCLVAYAAYGM